MPITLQKYSARAHSRESANGMQKTAAENNARVYDGTKSTSLSEYTPEYTSARSARIGTWQAYASVAYAYKACHMRAQATARMPFTLHKIGSDTALEEQPMYAPLARALSAAIYRTELAMCVYGRAYWLKDDNGFGMQYPVWLLPTSIEPRYEYGRGLVRFDRYRNERSFFGEKRALMQSFAPEELVYFWLPSLTSELGYGVAPVHVALQAAGVLANLDRFAENFFMRGAIKATLLQVDGTPPKSELEALQTWWKRMVAGVQKAWESVAIRASVNPVVIGEGLADIQDDKISERRRQDIAAALQVPYSMLNSNGVNRAVSEQDTENFYDTLIIPECQLLERVINDQFLEDMRLIMRIRPERLEAMQQREVRKATALQKLTGNKPILSVDEARAMMGYSEQPEDMTGNEQTEIYGYHLEQGIVRRNEMRARLGLPPEDDTGERQRKELRAALQIVQQARAADLPLPAALELAGLGELARAYENSARFQSNDQPMSASEDASEDEATKRTSATADPELDDLHALMRELNALYTSTTPAPEQITPDDLFSDPWLQQYMKPRQSASVAQQPASAEQQPTHEDAPQATGEATGDETAQTRTDDTEESADGTEGHTESHSE